MIINKYLVILGTETKIYYIQGSELYNGGGSYPQYEDADVSRPA